jgi:hypothetical protein
MEKDVPYMVYEGTMARFERTIKRLLILLAFVIGLLFISNAYWIYSWSQYEYANVTVDSKDGGNAAYMGDGSSGVINNGEGGSSETDQEE